MNSWRRYWKNFPCRNNYWLLWPQTNHEHDTKIFLKQKSTVLLALITCWSPPSKSRVQCPHPGAGQCQMFPAPEPGAQLIRLDNGLAFTSVMTTAPGRCLEHASGKFRAVGRKSDPVTRSYGRYKFCVIATKHPWWWQILLMIGFFKISNPSGLIWAWSSSIHSFTKLSRFSKPIRAPWRPSSPSVVVRSDL